MDYFDYFLSIQSLGGLLLIALPWIRSFALVVAEVHRKADTAQETLTVAKIFAFGGIGFAGTTSQEELAFRSILVLPSDTAKKRLERLRPNHMSCEPENGQFLGNMPL